MLTPSLLRLAMMFKDPRSNEDEDSLDNVASDLPGGGWNQAAAEAPDNPPGIDLASLFKPGPAQMAFVEHLKNAPKRQDRSFGTKLGLTLASAFLGPQKTLAAYNAPHEQDVQDWELTSKGLAANAGLEERTQSNQARNIMMQRADELARQKAAEQERKDKEAEIDRDLNRERETNRDVATEEFRKKQLEGEAEGRRQNDWYHREEIRVKDEAAKLKAHGGNLSSTTKNQIDASKVAIRNSEDIVNLLRDPDLQARLGPASGRLSSIEMMIGDADPKIARLGAALHGYALANMGIHRMRNAQEAHRLLEARFGNRMTAENIIAGIEGLNGIAQSYVELGREAGYEFGNAPSEPLKPNSGANSSEYQAIMDMIKKKK